MKYNLLINHKYLKTNKNLLKIVFNGPQLFSNVGFDLKISIQHFDDLNLDHTTLQKKIFVHDMKHILFI